MIESFPYWSQNKPQVQHRTRNKRPDTLNLPPAFEIEVWDPDQIYDYRSRKYLHIHIKMIKNGKSPSCDNSSELVSQKWRLFLKGDYVTKGYHVWTEQRKWSTGGRTTCMFHLTHASVHAPESFQVIPIPSVFIFLTLRKKHWEENFQPILNSFRLLV